jgi:hypothetical protein
MAVAFLKKHDLDVHNTVLSIKAEEEGHREFGKANGSQSIIYQEFA